MHPSVHAANLLSVKRERRPNGVQLLAQALVKRVHKAGIQGKLGRVDGGSPSKIRERGEGRGEREGAAANKFSTGTL